MPWNRLTQHKHTPDGNESPATIQTNGKGKRSESEIRRYVDNVAMSWILNNVWMFMITGAAFTKFAQSIELPDRYFGILAAAPYIGALFQIPASIVLESIGHRKATTIICLLISRGIWVFIAMIPWVIPADMAPWRWASLVLLVTLCWIFNNLAGPANTGWLADTVPSRLRGRFVSFCLRWSQPFVLVVVLTVGYLIDLAEKAHLSQPALMLKLCSMILALGGLIGFLGILRHTLAPDPKPVKPMGWNFQLIKDLKKPLASAGYRRYLAVNFVFIIGTGFIGQYIWLYMFDVGHMTALFANLLMVAMQRLITLFTYRFWGRQIDAHGKKPVMLMCMSVMTLGFVGWIIAGQGGMVHILIALPIVITEASVLPGWEISNLNIMLDFSSAKQGGTSAAVAINALVMALGGILSGLIGSGFSDIFADVHIKLPSLNMVVTYHVLLMLFVVFIRLIVCLLILRLHEPKASATRDAMRIVTSGIFHNTRQAILMPTRIVGHVGRWTYKVRSDD